MISLLVGRSLVQSMQYIIKILRYGLCTLVMFTGLLSMVSQQKEYHKKYQQRSYNRAHIDLQLSGILQPLAHFLKDFIQKLIRMISKIKRGCFTDGLRICLCIIL